MYTKVATMIWSSADAESNPVIESARDAYIKNAEAAGTTDGSFIIKSPTVTKRFWLDQTSAEAWSAFITEQAANIGATCQVVISDHVST